MPRTKGPKAILDGFISRYDPEIAANARIVLAKMRTRLPGAIELVYDNYNALAIGFGPSERASECIFSIALYPRWITLFFLHGVGLPDPKGLLQGSGKFVRHIVLDRPDVLDSAPVRALMKVALKHSVKPLAAAQASRIVIKSISEKQRPRRSSAKRK